MKKSIKKTGLRGQKGITVAEVAVALAIISIISAAAVGMALNSVKVEANFVAVTGTQTGAQNVLDCFHFSDDADTFYQALQKTGAYEWNPEENAYILTTNNMTVTVKASFSPKKLEYTAAKHNGETIYTYTFPLEGGATP